MHFRVRKNVIQLVRMRYEPETKRGRSEIVGSIKLANPVLNEELQAQLTADEIAEFAHWLETHHRKESVRQELAALTLADTLALAEAWFQQQGNSATAQDITPEILAAWQSLRRVLGKNKLID